MHLELTIPTITTVLDPDISNNSATLHVSLIENGDVYGGPSGEKFQFTERGFYFDDVTPPINKYTIAPIDSLANDTSWNSLGTTISQLDDGLEAGVPYYYQGYGYIGNNTTSGSIVGISGEIQTIQIPDISFNDYTLGNAAGFGSIFHGLVEAIGQDRTSKILQVFIIIPPKVRETNCKMHQQQNLHFLILLQQLLQV